MTQNKSEIPEIQDWLENKLYQEAHETFRDGEDLRKSGILKIMGGNGPSKIFTRVQSLEDFKAVK